MPAGAGLPLPPRPIPAASQLTITTQDVFQRPRWQAPGGAVVIEPAKISHPGELLEPAHREAGEIHDRYGPGHLVSPSIQRATPMILRAVEQAHQRAAQTA